MASAELEKNNFAPPPPPSAPEYKTPSEDLTNDELTKEVEDLFFIFDRGIPDYAPLKDYLITSIGISGIKGPTAIPYSMHKTGLSLDEILSQDVTALTIAGLTLNVAADASKVLLANMGDSTEEKRRAKEIQSRPGLLIGRESILEATSRKIQIVMDAIENGRFDNDPVRHARAIEAVSTAHSYDLTTLLPPGSMIYKDGKIIPTYDDIVGLPVFPKVTAVLNSLQVLQEAQKQGYESPEMDSALISGKRLLTSSLLSKMKHQKIQQYIEESFMSQLEMLDPECAQDFSSRYQELKSYHRIERSNVPKSKIRDFVDKMIERVGPLQTDSGLHR